MERTVVVYTSKYGATEKYAGWIGEELDCPVFSLDSFKKADLDGYDNIIYGGGVQAGGIKGFDKFKKWIKPLVGKPGKKIVIFSSSFASCPKSSLRLSIGFCIFLAKFPPAMISN